MAERRRFVSVRTFLPSCPPEATGTPTCAVYQLTPTLTLKQHRPCVRSLLYSVVIRYLILDVIVIIDSGSVVVLGLGPWP